MGDLFKGSNKSTSTTTTDTGPSKFQQPFISGAFESAKATYDAQKGTPYYQGETYAGMTGDAKDTLASLKNYATGTGLQTAGQLSAIGQGLVGNAQKATDSLDQFRALAGTDATAANIAAASKYAANPEIQGMIDANTRDVIRTLREETLPGIDRQASGTGNINSSRAGVAAGIAQRGAADRAADISASIRGDAYNRGLAMAQADRGQQLDALSTAATGYGNLTGQGIAAIGQGNDAAYKAFGAATGADATLQADRQGQNDAAYKKWLGEDNRDWDLLQKYYGVVGANQWGQSGTSTGVQTQITSPSLLQSILGTAATAASFI
ncbi:hypothetical protein SR41_04635 [Sphingomonas melonis]|uniref:Uncharacterized protein n=1 Tax=Sphingomonas melonis TaxID=152682 RepID=A0A0D1MA92_9SPHN|nr:hypothetical protein [Sphingomonas melonis]KIU29300.1 hypothetical protein SR41_04635 [Sphingomonas melonis]